MDAALETLRSNLALSEEEKEDISNKLEKYERSTEQHEANKGAIEKVSILICHNIFHYQIGAFNSLKLFMLLDERIG